MRVLVLSLLLVVGCGASARQKTIATTLATLNAASDAFVVYDQDHRTQIVTTARDHASGQAALNEWDGTVEHVLKDRGDAYQALATAATLNDDPSLATALQAAVFLKKELTTLGVLK